MKRWQWFTVGLPLLLSLSIFVMIASGRLADNQLDLQIDDKVLVVLGGVMLSLLLAVNFASQRWLAALHRQSMAHAREETAEMHRQFLNRLDHEMKNPLMALRAGLLNLRTTTDEARKYAIVDSLSVQTDRLQSLVADLRKVASIGIYPLEWLPLHPAELLHEVYAAARENEAAQSRDLHLRLPVSDAPVYGDRDLLALALHNLLGNALKYTQTGDRIELRAFRDRHEMVFEVADTGPGIPKAEQRAIWQELYRGKAAQGQSGSGIGLALVQAITERHYGRVALRSAPGEGTTVSMRLPLSLPEPLPVGTLKPSDQ